MAWVQLTPEGQEAIDKTKSVASDAASTLAGQGKDALRQLVPWRDPGQPPAKTASSLAAASLVGGTEPQDSPPLLSAQAPGSPATDHLERSRTAPLGATSPGDPVTRLSGGVNLAHDREGNRIYTQGTPGQDGYAMAKVAPGFSASNRDVPARPMVPIAQEHGAPQPRNLAVSQLAGKSPLDISHENWKRMSINQGTNQPGGPPKYLTREEGAAIGLGWKGRSMKYREDVDAYNRMTGNVAAMDIEAMREAGAGRRALLHANVANDTNDIARKRLAGDLQLNQAQIETQQLAQQKGGLELDNQRTIRDLNNRLLATSDPKEQRALHRQILAMHGTHDNQKYQIVTREEPDPNMPGNTIKTPYVIDQDNPANTYKVGGDGGQGAKKPADFEAVMDETQLKKYRSLPADQQKAVFSQWQQSLQK